MGLHTIITISIITIFTTTTSVIIIFIIIIVIIIRILHGQLSPRLSPNFSNGQN